MLALMITSLVGNLAEPLIYLVGLGYGVGALIGEIDGRPYVTFLAAGMICYSTMNSASFEALYSAFARMQVQRTWEAIMNAPTIAEVTRLRETIEQLQSAWTLRAGDLIFTGTPAGVGAVVRGDLMEGAIDGLGRLRVKVA